MERLTYEWYLDGVRVQGQNSDTYTGPGGGMLQVRVRDFKAGEAGAPGRDLPIGDEAVMAPEELDRLERLCAAMKHPFWWESASDREAARTALPDLIAEVRRLKIQRDNADTTAVAKSEQYVAERLAHERTWAEAERLREALKRAPSPSKPHLPGFYPLWYNGLRAGALAPIPPA